MPLCRICACSAHADSGMRIHLEREAPQMRMHVRLRVAVPCRVSPVPLSVRRDRLSGSSHPPGIGNNCGPPLLLGSWKDARELGSRSYRQPKPVCSQSAPAPAGARGGPSGSVRPASAAHSCGGMQRIHTTGMVCPTALRDLFNSPRATLLEMTRSAGI